jgi:hypothetical protein
MRWSRAARLCLYLFVGEHGRDCRPVAVGVRSAGGGRPLPFLGLVRTRRGRSREDGSVRCGGGSQRVARCSSGAPTSSSSVGRSDRSRSRSGGNGRAAAGVDIHGSLHQAQTRSLATERRPSQEHAARQLPPRLMLSGRLHCRCGPLCPSRAVTDPGLGQAPVWLAERAREGMGQRGTQQPRSDVPFAGDVWPVARSARPHSCGLSRGPSRRRHSSRHPRLLRPRPTRLPSAWLWRAVWRCTHTHTQTEHICSVLHLLGYVVT